MKGKILLCLSVILVILWMGVIFLFSAAPSDKSNAGSKRIARFIVEKIHGDKSDAEKYNLTIKYNKVVRKIAHASVYFILVIFVSSVICVFKKKLFVCNLISVFFCFVYACSDEIHQMFVMNRSPLFTDVLIDTFGAIVGCFVFNIIYGKVKKEVSIN